MDILGVKLPEVQVTLGRRVVTGFRSKVPLPAIVNGSGAMVLSETVEFDEDGQPLSDLGRVWRRVLVSQARGQPWAILTDGDDVSRTRIWCFQAS